MISQKYRFHGHGSLRFLFAKGKAVHSGALTLKFVVNKRRKTPRLTVIVSKKIHKNAVVRNRIRRRLYEIIRRALPEINPLYDMAFIVKNVGVATKPYPELHDEVQKLLEKADVLQA